MYIYDTSLIAQGSHKTLTNKFSFLHNDPDNILQNILVSVLASQAKCDDNDGINN